MTSGRGGRAPGVRHTGIVAGEPRDEEVVFHHPLMAALVVASAASAQDLTRYSDEGLGKELSAIADSGEAVMVPMRGGIGLSTNIWRPKGATGQRRSGEP